MLVGVGTSVGAGVPLGRGDGSGVDVTVGAGAVSLGVGGGKVEMPVSDGEGAGVRGGAVASAVRVAATRVCTTWSIGVTVGIGFCGEHAVNRPPAISTASTMVNR